MDSSTPGFPVPHYLLEFAQTHILWANEAIQASHPLLPPSPFAFSLSKHQCKAFQWVGFSNQVTKLLELQLQHQSFQCILSVESILGLTDLISLLQGTLKSLLQHHNSKASILWHSAFFMVQLSHPYMTTGKTIASTKRTLISKMMSLLFNLLSRFIIAFLPRRKRLLILRLQSPSAVILEPEKINLSLSHDLSFLDAEDWLVSPLKFVCWSPNYVAIFGDGVPTERIKVKWDRRVGPWPNRVSILTRRGTS